MDLCMASERGFGMILKSLLPDGVDVEVCDKNGNRPLYLACQEGHFEVVVAVVNANA